MCTSTRRHSMHWFTTAALMALVLGCGTGNETLSGAEAQSSPLAQVAVDFLTALRASDMDAVARTSTADQLARVKTESENPAGDFQHMTAMMFGELPASNEELRGAVTSVERHGNRGAVYFETATNVWFVPLIQEGGDWKVTEF